jgi:MFS superfamily sulfate permease-like transporter
MTLAGAEPAALWPKLQGLWAARGSVTEAAVAVAVGTIVVIQGLKRIRPHWPGLLVAVIGASVAAAILRLPVETIGSRFGELPRLLPVPSLPDLSLAALDRALPYAISFAPLASAIPLAALAGVLAIVAWNMIEKEEFWMLLRTSSGDALVLLATFVLVIFRDLTEGILVGFVLGAVLFIRRMSDAAHVEERAPLVPEGRADELTQYDSDIAAGREFVVCHIKGAFSFGAASTVGAVLDRIADRPRAFVVDFAEVPFLDSTAAHSVELLARKMARTGGRLYLSGTGPDIRRMLLSTRLRPPRAQYAGDIEEAVRAAQSDLAASDMADVPSPAV